jgi:hypothetical protein
MTTLDNFSTETQWRVVGMDEMLRRSGFQPRANCDFEHPKPLALVPKERSLMYSSAMLSQLRLFGGVRCYRQSLHTDGIETQKLGKTICDVPTAKSI